MVSEMARTGWVALCFALFLVATAFSAPIQGNPDGVDDDDRDYGGCGCHGSPSSGSVNMSASGLTLRPEQEVSVTVNVTGTQLSDARIIGVFLLRDLTGSDDHPSQDGWTVLADPNGGQYNYVEQVASSSDDLLQFQWTLQAPSQEGEYQLKAMVDHGGGKGYLVSDATGLTFQISVPKEPQFVSHTFPEEVLVNEPIPLSANFTDDDEVEEVYVTYRPVGDTEYQSVTMTLSAGTVFDGHWTVSLPGQTRTGELHFDITASDRDYYTECHVEDHIITIGASGTPVLDHTALTWVYVDQEAPVEVSALNAPHGVALYYREVGLDTFIGLNMTAWGQGLFAAHIPAQSLTGYLDYYLQAFNGTLNATSRIFKLEIRPYLDLKVVDLVLSREPQVGQEVVLTITLQNIGTLPAQGVWLNVVDDFYPQADLAYVGVKDNLSLDTQSTRTELIWWTPQEPSEPGTREHVLRISVGYADGQQEEANVTNNELTREVLVAPEGEHEEHSPSLIEQLILGGLLVLSALCILILVVYKRLARGWLVEDQGSESDREVR